MIVDSHIHIFPDKLCPGTVEKLAHTHPDYVMPYYYDGSRNGAQEALQKAGIGLGIMLPIVTNPGQTQNVNDFAAWVQKQSDHIIAFGSVHPDDPKAMDEITRIKELGLRGIKLHPDYQGFFVEEQRLFPLYRRISNEGLPLVFHGGLDPISPNCIHATPAGIREVAQRYPQLKIIAAHTGGLYSSDEPRDYYGRLDNLYFDTSMAHYYFNTDDYLRLIEIYGPEHFLFGTDGPWGSGEESIEFIRALKLSAAEEEMIFEKNACKTMRISCNQ